LDFVALSRQNADPAAFLKLSRRMTLVWGSVLILFGLLPWGHLLEAGLTVASLPFGSLLGLFLLGTFDSRANATGSLVGMFGGLASVLLVLRFTTIAFTWYVLIGSCLTVALGALVSRMFAQRTATS
jgi:Na+/pantothenate symporter